VNSLIHEKFAVSWQKKKMEWKYCILK